MYQRALTTAANARASDFAPAIYGVSAGPNLLTCYEPDDLFDVDIPPALGVNLLLTPITLSQRFLGTHAKASDPPATIVTARSHGTGPRWLQMNPSDGIFVDAGMSAWLAAMKADGAETIVTIFGTPTWVSARPTEGPDELYGMMGGLAEPADMSKLGAFVTWLVSTYGSQIDYIEVWNEPKYSYGNSSFFSGTPAKLAEMARTINLAAKAAKPSLPVLGVGCTGVTSAAAGWGVDLTNRFLTASDGSGGTGKDWIDILSVHTYVHNGTNDLTLLLPARGYIDTLKANNGISLMPVWSTEFGLAGPLFYKYTGPAASRIQLLARHAIYNAVIGMERCVQYSFFQSTYGFADDPIAVAEWNRWCVILNGATVSIVNRVGASEQLACVIDGHSVLL